MPRRRVLVTLRSTRSCATAAGGAAFALHALLRPYGQGLGALRLNPG